MTISSTILICVSLLSIDIYEWKDIPYMPKHLNVPVPASSSSTLTSSSVPSSSSTTVKVSPSTGSIHPKHKLDIFIPSKPFPRPKQPIFIFLHGGAWIRGDKRHYANLYWNVGIAAAMNQCVGIVPSYRLTPEVAHPTHIQDIAHAVAWSIIYGSKYGGDTNNIILAGHSAGGHLALVLATQPTYLYTAFENFRPYLTSSFYQQNPHIHDILVNKSPIALANVLRGIIGISGVYNIPRLATSPFGEMLINPAFGSQLIGWKKASPVHTVGLGYDSGQIISSSSSSLSSIKSFQLSGITSGNIPLLLMNAEQDFHLDQDAEEMDVAVAFANTEYLKQTFSDNDQEINRSVRRTILRRKNYNEKWRPKITSTVPSSTTASVVNLSATFSSSNEATNPIGSIERSTTTISTKNTDTPPVLPTDGLGTGITWLPGRSSFVERCIIEGTNHLSVVSGMGQPNDPTTDAVFDFVKRITVVPP